MGMYTEFHLNVELNKDVPQGVIDTLHFMLGDLDTCGVDNKHPLFQSDRWRWMLQQDSYYFPSDTHSTLRKDDISRTWFLNIKCNLKNYDHEIQKFVDWIMPYTQTPCGDSGAVFIGYYRYESNDHPTLIYTSEGEYCYYFMDVEQIRGKYLIERHNGVWR